MIEEKNIKNKMIGKEEVKTKDSTKEDIYFFPEYQVSITATSREEATNKLQATLLKKDK